MGCSQRNAMIHTVESTEDEVVRQAKSGISGPTSRLLLRLSVLGLTILLVQLAKSQQWTLLVASLLGFSPCWILALPSISGYLWWKQEWTPLFWVGLALLLRLGSAFIRVSYIRRRVRSGTPVIDPEEGPMEMFFLTSLCAFLAGALLLGGLFSLFAWVLFAGCCVVLVACINQRLRPRWAQVHYPLMHRYAASAALVDTLSGRMGKEYDIRRALRLVLNTVYPDKTEAEISAIIEAADRKRASFCDRLDIERLIFKTKALDQQKTADLGALLDEFSTRPIRPRVSTSVRCAVQLSPKSLGMFSVMARGLVISLLLSRTAPVRLPASASSLGKRPQNSHRRSDSIFRP